MIPVYKSYCHEGTLHDEPHTVLTKTRNMTMITHALSDPGYQETEIIPKRELVAAFI